MQCVQAHKNQGCELWVCGQSPVWAVGSGGSGNFSVLRLWAWTCQIAFPLQKVPHKYSRPFQYVQGRAWARPGRHCTPPSQQRLAVSCLTWQVLGTAAHACSTEQVNSRLAGGCLAQLNEQVQSKTPPWLQYPNWLLQPCCPGAMCHANQHAQLPTPPQLRVQATCAAKQPAQGT